MEASPVLALIFSAVLLCSAAPPPEQVTCTNTDSSAAARVALENIHEWHDHGYKFNLKEVKSITVEQTADGCNIELKLELGETTCHIVNPKHFLDCDFRDETARGVVATCDVSITVNMYGVATVMKYKCDTRQALSNIEMMMICPDCPPLVSLKDEDGVKGVKAAVKKFNENTTNQHYYMLQEVGRIRSGYIMMTGMAYYTEFALVETRCPRTTAQIAGCSPLCPARANYAVCRATYIPNRGGIDSVDCEYYPPESTAPLDPGVEEPVCNIAPHIEDLGFPARGCCGGTMPNADQALHPICSMPLF